MPIPIVSAISWALSLEESIVFHPGHGSESQEARRKMSLKTCSEAIVKDGTPVELFCGVKVGHVAPLHDEAASQNAEQVNPVPMEHRSTNSHPEGTQEESFFKGAVGARREAAETRDFAPVPPSLPTYVRHGTLKELE